MSMLVPGSHLVVLGDDSVGVLGRQLGLHVRDSITVLLPGPTTAIAWLFRVPLEGTLVESLIQHQAGVVNVEATAITWAFSARWPTNLLVVHTPECQCIKMRDEQFGSHDENGTRRSRIVEKWLCAKDCAAALLDEQSGDFKSEASERGERHGNVYGGGKGPSGPNTVRGHADRGGAARYYPQFATLLEALLWFGRLATTPQASDECAADGDSP